MNLMPGMLICNQSIRDYKEGAYQMSSRRVRDLIDGRYITVRMPSVTIDEMYLVSASHEHDASNGSNKNLAMETTLETWGDFYNRLDSLDTPANGNIEIAILKPIKLSVSARARIKRERFNVRTVVNRNKVRIDYTICGCSICERYDKIPQLT